MDVAGFPGGNLGTIFWRLSLHAPPMRLIRHKMRENQQLTAQDTGCTKDHVADGFVWPAAIAVIVWG